MDFLKLIFFIIIIVVLGFGFLFIIIPADDSDISAFDRSEIKVSIDAMTGCHYLSASFGGVTPRLDSDGKHICEKELK